MRNGISGEANPLPVLTEFQCQQQAVDFMLLGVWKQLEEVRKAAGAIWPDRAIVRHVVSLGDMVTLLRDRIYTMREV